ncbi:Cytochrome b2 like protein [Verticillium longisporum]|nr:Cytochrome b2 like protein [Verticillium longisporum]
MTPEGISSEKPIITLDNLNKHNSSSDCWISVHNKVWDITDFIGEHPGGPSVLLRCAGSNATKSFDQVHAPDIIEELPKEKFKGFLEEPSSDVSASAAQCAAERNTTTAPTTSPTNEVPPLDSVLSAPDFEVVASKALTPKTWAFYSSAATDLITHGKNKELRQHETSILGFKSTTPFFIAPAAMARLVHPDGELALSRASAKEGIIQCISSNASYTLRSIMTAAPATQPFFFQLYINSERQKTIEILKSARFLGIKAIFPFFFQLYINSERQKTIEILKSARSLGIKAIFVTVDAPVPGKREADERAAQAVTVRSAISGGESSKDKKGSGLGRLMAQYIDKSLTWNDLSWIREASGVPIVLKGVQTADDAKMAVDYGVDVILLSNHGGRSLYGSQASILVLMELRKQCPEVFDKLEVYVDGGFERGSDILKAVALGATAVGIGRPTLYSLVYGQEGVEHLVQSKCDV